MADSTLTKLLQTITSGDSRELRLATLKVLGVVGSAKERSVVKTLLDVLADDDLDLRIAAIETLGQLQVEEALNPLGEFVRQGGLELEPAVHAASLLGARGAKLMGKVTQEVSPSVRSRIGAVLAKSNTGNALVVTAQGLLDEDPKVVESTARSLATEVPAYTSPQRHALAKFLIESLGAKNIPPKSEAALLRVLSALHEPKAEELFWSRILPPYAVDVRAAALQSLGNTAPTSEKRLQALLTCAGEKDFQIVAGALMILKKVPVNAKNSKHWIKLLDAPDVQGERHQVRAVELHARPVRVDREDVPDGRPVDDHDIGARATFHEVAVVAVVPDQRVGIGPAEDAVVTGPTRERIVALKAFFGIEQHSLDPLLERTPSAS